jgi:hypothetical protein
MSHDEFFRSGCCVLAGDGRIIRTANRQVSAVNVRPARSYIYGAAAALVAGTIVLAATAHGAEKQDAAEKEKEAIAELELGVSPEWTVPRGAFSLGPSLGIEVTPIKDWLEIEVEVSPAFGGGGQTEWQTELIFKKPFDLSDKVEVMPGIGPAWFYKTGHGDTGSSVGAVALVDFQIWPSAERKLGWFIEPSYSYDFGREHEQSLGVTVGILIPIR